jgi:hypothetical protein
LRRATEARFASLQDVCRAAERARNEAEQKLKDTRELALTLEHQVSSLRSIAACSDTRKVWPKVFVDMAVKHIRVCCDPSEGHGSTDVLLDEFGKHSASLLDEVDKHSAALLDEVDKHSASL